ncbi:hypothetical protein MESS2_790127 [Mesorhizobium metallidurans STM 2683]|uniref:Uncharacterized protein n=1 Tax=Mesorhizobium metallidurans STM 2683 TaxID=1297569 RepID=M5EY05_9HYPH|nr:hypothetical protein MESS2_790127 [Mesorhizobium metallidurans STM 2683]
MSVRMPSNFGRSGAQESALDLLGHEILAEKAAALGRAGQRVEQTLARLRENGDDEHRPGCSGMRPRPSTAISSSANCAACASMTR